MGNHKDLFRAVRNNDFEILESLLNEVDVNVVNVSGQNVLFEAIESKNVPMVKYLIEQKADVNLKDKYKIVPVIKAAESGSAEILKLLLDAGADLSENGHVALFRAAFQNMEATLELLCMQNINLNVKDDMGRTLLMQVCTLNFQNVADILIKAGAKLNLQDSDGFTALMHAVHAGSDKCARLLLSYGVNVGFKNKAGQTAIEVATNEYPTLVEVFS